MNRDRIAKAARAATRQGQPATREQVRALLKGYPEYDDNQPRAADGTWGGGGGGGSSAGKPAGESGWQRAGRYALIGAGVLAGHTILSHGGRYAARAMYARSLAQRRAANAAVRRVKAESAARAARDAAAAREARSLLGRMRGDLRAAFGRLGGRTQQRAARWDASAERARQAAARRTVDKLPPKARARLRRAVQRGADTPISWLEG